MTIQEYIQLLGVDDDQLRNRILENTLTEEDIQNYVLAGSWTTLEQDLSLNLPFYRARYDSDNWDDKEDITQYGYIQNQQNIRQFRYNREHEQVLYTSTNPLTAFQEIEDENNQHDIYISKWGKRNEAVRFRVLLNINRDGIKEKSTAGKYKKIMEANKNNDIVQAEKAGKILEADQIDGYENLNYRFSSVIASTIFNAYDAILTVSKKSAGKELNVTFKREAVDQNLELKAVYKINYQDCNNLLYKIAIIGVPENGRISWYRWGIDVNSVELKNQQDITNEQIRHIVRMHNTQHFRFLLYPNINADINAKHTGIIEDLINSIRYEVTYHIRLL